MATTSSGGWVFPVSHCDTRAWLTPSCAATSACESPFVLRASLSQLATLFTNCLDPFCATPGSTRGARRN